MNYSKEELIAYRIQKSKETLSDTVLLLEAERWSSAANRLYYACFYMILAYFASAEIKTATHNGVKTKFNQELIKSGKIDQYYGRAFNKLFGIRQDADYEDFQPLRKEDLQPIVQDVFQLMEMIEQLIIKENKV